MKKTGRQKFTVDEDQILKKAVKDLGEVWDRIANRLPGRSPKQCQDRYTNYLREGLINGPWTEEEDVTVIQLRKEIGPKWVKMTQFLPGRSGNDIKNRWHKHLIKREDAFNDFTVLRHKSSSLKFEADENKESTIGSSGSDCISSGDEIIIKSKASLTARNKQNGNEEVINEETKLPFCFEDQTLKDMANAFDWGFPLIQIYPNDPIFILDSRS